METISPRALLGETEKLQKGVHLGKDGVHVSKKFKCPAYHIVSRLKAAYDNNLNHNQH